jgi:Putative prokaryotic signal transducing protein
MYCPKCRSEFLPSATTCPDCNLPLVAELPPEPSHQAQEVRCVLETSDPDVLMVVASVLRAAGIPYWTPGESTMDLWPLGSGGGALPSNLISTGVLVPADRYEEAAALLDTRAEIVEPSPEQDSGGEVEGDGESEDV